MAHHATSSFAGNGDAVGAGSVLASSQARPCSSRMIGLCGVIQVRRGISPLALSRFQVRSGMLLSWRNCFTVELPLLRPATPGSGLVVDIAFAHLLRATAK